MKKINKEFNCFIINVVLWIWRMENCRKYNCKFKGLDRKIKYFDFISNEIVVRPERERGVLAAGAVMNIMNLNE